MIPLLMYPLRRKLARVASGLPWPVRRDLGRYLHHARRDRRQRTVLRSGDRVPAYWLLLPLWIWKTQARHARPQLLNDVLWAQYCLYLAVRINDDLLDGQAKSANLLSASRAFLVEGEKTFRTCFPRPSPFWQYYRSCIRTTRSAILRVQMMQKDPHTEPSRLLQEYSRVSAIFKVGSFALCTLLRHRDWMPEISLFA